MTRTDEDSYTVTVKAPTGVLTCAHSNPGPVAVTAMEVWGCNKINGSRELHKIRTYTLITIIFVLVSAGQLKPTVIFLESSFETILIAHIPY